MTPSKDALETAAPAAKTSSPAAPAKPDLNRLRADAVSLDVPVKVHGSRVTEVVRGVTPHTEPFEEETSTMIVFPHGGVVRMATSVSVGQMLVLTNQRTSQDAICRVVKVRAYSNTQAYVEVEFTHRQLGYWGVHFPADDDDALTQGSAGTVRLADEAPAKPVVASVSMKVENISKPAPARNESAFAQIGSQEEVQLAATGMEKPKVLPIAAPTPPAPPVRASVPPAPVAQMPAVPVVAVPPVVHVPPVVPISPAASAAAIHAAPPQIRVVSSRTPVQEESLELESEPEVESPRSAGSFGTLTGGVGRSAAPSAKATDFGARLDSSLPAESHVSAAPRSANWMWIAACAFFLVAGLAGGAFYFRQHSPGATQSAQQAAQPSQQAGQTAPAASQPASQPSAVQATQPAAVAAVADSAAPTDRAPIQQPVQEATAVQSRAANVPSAHQLKPAPAPAPAAPNFATNAARPVERQAGAANQADAPAVAVNAAGSGGALPDVLSSSSAGPAPPLPMERIHVGGLLIAPKLSHSVPPVYPGAAARAGIVGDVVIRADVDKAGNVGTMKILSGPVALQQAATNAMRQWKYSPGTLDGQPIATEVTVTLKFSGPQ
jgi:TonB family protein